MRARVRAQGRGRGCPRAAARRGADGGRRGQVRLNYQQNVSDALAILPKTQTGLDINLKFTGCGERGRARVRAPAELR